MRFFAEIVSDVGVLERRLFQMMPDTQLNEIVRQRQLPSEHWTVEVTLPPSLEAPADRSLRDRLAETPRRRSCLSLRTGVEEECSFAV